MKYTKGITGQGPTHMPYSLFNTHFVNIYKIKNNSVTVLDPSYGRTKFQGISAFIKDFHSKIAGFSAGQYFMDRKWSTVSLKNSEGK